MIDKTVSYGSAALTLLVAIIVFLTPLETNAQAEMRVFTSTAGKTIKGQVTSANEKEVTIKLENGNEITGGLNFFSAGDRTYIAEWLKKNPIQTKFDFDVAYSKERTDRDKATEGNTIVVYEKWRYKVTIENRSKVGLNGVDLSGVELQYNIVKKAKADARQAGSLHQGMRRTRSAYVKAGNVSMGKLGYLRDLEVKTDTFPLNESELAPGWYYADGGKDEKADELEGIWIKLVKDGRVIHEKKALSKDGELAGWVDPKSNKSAED